MIIKNTPSSKTMTQIALQWVFNYDKVCVFVFVKLAHISKTGFKSILNLIFLTFNINNIN